MYYSKSNAPSIPKNYGGNAFRVIDESNRTYPPERQENPKNDIEIEQKNQESAPIPEGKKQKGEIPLISSLFSGISVEDVLLLGLIFVIHEDNPNDPVLFLLLILLLSK